MSPADQDWIEANNLYLNQSLKWLRARLKNRLGVQAPVIVSTPSAEEIPAAPRRSWWSFGSSPDVPPATTAPLALVDSTVDEESAATDRTAAAEINPPPALLVLAERLGLTAFERDTLLLCAASELEPAIAALFTPGGATGQFAAPTFALALHILDNPSWDALSPHRPLRYARLIEVNQGGATPLTIAPLRADERIVHYLKGLNSLDERLTDLLTLAGDTEIPLLATSQEAIAEDILIQLKATGGAAQIPLVSLIGSDVGSQLETARYVAGKLGRRLYQVEIDALPGATELEGVVRLWQRERLLLPIALFVDAHELAATGVDRVRAFQAFARRDIGPAFIGLREAPGRAFGHAVGFEVSKPTAQEQHAAWEKALEVADGGSSERLAGHFDLSLRDIATVTGFATAASGGTPDEDQLWSAARRLVLPRLDQLAERIEPRATWDDIVLTDEAALLIHQIADQARHRYRVYEEWGYAARMNRGLGISALFAGESGTGKTMAAEVIANELRLALYRIDLSGVVSKYIGETEKNLSRLFDAAEQGGAILLFDEADALFGKRSEVKDSHDRYANIEINYLLQRTESFRGIAILATNMKSALDAAFMRRLRFVVNFPYPGPSERELMWRKTLPEAVPREDLDYARLARFHLSGGNIHSVALNAAFMAASRGVPMNENLIVAALRNELKKLDKPANEAALR
ncbi:MAG TPA: ATP-binding protein [Sphingomicrobium sp.]|nr:ATP-binding protein [Sphingomicrobium sp.]